MYLEIGRIFHERQATLVGITGATVLTLASHQYQLPDPGDLSQIHHLLP